MTQSVLQDFFSLLTGEDGVFHWIGTQILTIEIGGITLLRWIIGILLVSAIVATIFSLKPSFPRFVHSSSETNKYKKL